MAKNLIFNAEPALGTVTQKLTVDLANYELFALKDSSVDELGYVNITSDVSCPETISYGSQKVNNVYKSTGISAAYQAPSNVGTKVLLRYHTILTELSSDDPNYRVDIPFGITITITSGETQSLTDEIYLSLVKRAFGFYFAGGKITTQAEADASLLSRLRRGGLVPFNE